MSEKLIELLMSWGINERLATSQVEYLAGYTVPFAIWETIYTTVLATLFAYVIGLPLGIILVTGEKAGIRPLPAALMKVLNTIVNLLRSVPILILMVVPPSLLVSPPLLSPFSATAPWPVPSAAAAWVLWHCSGATAGRKPWCCT